MTQAPAGTPGCVVSGRGTRPKPTHPGATVALWATVAGGVVLYTLVGLGLRAENPGAARWAAVGGGAVLLGAGWWLAPRAARRHGLLAVLVAAVAFRALLLPAPLGSDDIYRFLWDGRVQGAGQNPYRYAPADPALADLRDEEVWPQINRRGVRTVYPPAAQAVFLGAWASGLRTVTGFKALVVAADLLALGLLVAALRRGGRDPTHAVAYAWNPAVLLGFAHAGHLESLVVAALLAAVLAWQRDRLAVAGALVGLAASFKLYPLLVLPAFLRARDGTWSWRRALGVAGVALGVLGAGYLPYLAGSGGALGWLGGYLAEEGYATGRRFLLLRWLGEAAPLVAAVVLLAVVAVVLRSHRSAATRAAWLLAAAMVVVTPVQSWYTTPLVALAVAGAASRAWPWLAVGYEASYVSVFFRPEGMRVSIPVRRAVALAAVLAAGAGHLRSRRSAAGPRRPPAPVSPGEVCVVLPAFDEADALPAALAGRPGDVRVLVVDNGSGDGTAGVARALGAEVVAEPRRGYGAACWAGAQAASGSRVLVFVDADATFDWDDLPALVEPVASGRADLVLGRRVPELREPGAMPWHVAVANRVLGRGCGLLAGVAVHDIGPFRAVRRDALLGLGMRDRTYGWPLEMVLRAGRAGLVVAETPVRYRARAGTSKVTGRPWPTVKAAARMALVLGRHAVTGSSR